MKRPGGQRCPPPAGTVMLHRFVPPSPQTTLSCRLPLVEGPQHAATETSSELWLTPSIGRTAYFFNRYAYEAQPVNSSSANLEAATFADMNSTGDWRAGGSRAWNPNASWRRMPCRRSLPPAYRLRPCRDARNAGRHDATLRFVAESSIHRERFATEAKRLCDVAALAGEVGDAVSVVRETQLNSEFAFASPRRTWARSCCLSPLHSRGLTLG